jgi:hypothetical protein
MSSLTLSLPDGIQVKGRFASGRLVAATIRARLSSGADGNSLQNAHKPLRLAEVLNFN